MADREYTQEEILAAWEKAGRVPGEDPAKVRVDDAPDGGGGGPIIRRDLFLSKDRGGWSIDAEGRARANGYKMADAARAHRRQEVALEKQQQEQLRHSYQKQAEEVGIPGAWTLLERIAQLEATVQQQQKQIVKLTEAISRR